MYKWVEMEEDVSYLIYLKWDLEEPGLRLFLYLMVIITVKS